MRAPRPVAEEPSGLFGGSVDDDTHVGDRQPIARAKGEFDGATFDVPRTCRRLFHGNRRRREIGLNNEGAFDVREVANDIADGETNEEVVDVRNTQTLGQVELLLGGHHTLLLRADNEGIVASDPGNARGCLTVETDLEHRTIVKINANSDDINGVDREVEVDDAAAQCGCG